MAEVDSGQRSPNIDAAIAPPPDARRIGMLPDAQPSPDAAPDAMPACSTDPVNLLVNGSFDDGSAPWLEDSGNSRPIIVNQSVVTSVSADSGMFLAWLGGYSSFGGATDTLQQDFTVPQDAGSAVVTGKLWIDSGEILGIPYDKISLELLSADTGVVLQTLKTWSNLDEGISWMPFSVDVTGSIAGKTLRLRAIVTVDFSRDTNFWLDTVAVTIARTCL